MGLTLEGKSCLVTGGSRGIGKAIALKLAELGADVAITYARSAEAANEVKAQIEAMGRNAKAIQADAVDFSQAEAVINELVSDWGKIDVLVNNAGITKDNLILRMAEDQWDDVITTNLKSIFNYSKVACSPNDENRGGSIINISSVVGISGNSDKVTMLPSKAGIIGFTKSYAKELASRNIRANVIAPGYITTDMTESLGDAVLEGIKSATPLGRAGNPDEIADAVAFLASDMSSYITGETIRVDGGMAM